MLLFNNYGYDGGREIKQRISIIIYSVCLHVCVSVAGSCGHSVSVDPTCNSVGVVL